MVVCMPACSRGTGLPGNLRPFTRIAASRDSTSRLNMVWAPVPDCSGGSSSAVGLPRSSQTSSIARVSLQTVSVTRFPQGSPVVVAWVRGR